MIQWQYIDMLSMLFLLVAGVEDGPSSVLEMLRKRPQSRTKYTQSSPVSRGWWPHQQHEVKISTVCLHNECIYTVYLLSVSIVSSAPLHGGTAAGNTGPGQ